MDATAAARIATAGPGPSGGTAIAARHAVAIRLLDDRRCVLKLRMDAGRARRLGLRARGNSHRSKHERCCRQRHREFFHTAPAVCTAENRQPSKRQRGPIHNSKGATPLWEGSKGASTPDPGTGRNQPLAESKPAIHRPLVESGGSA
jgi:hypothetical protein